MSANRCIWPYCIAPCANGTDLCRRHLTEGMRAFFSGFVDRQVEKLVDVFVPGNSRKAGM